MGVRGTYLVLKVGGSTIAEAVEVSLKLKAKMLYTTTQDGGINAGFMQGKVKMLIGGRFLFASDGANFDSLFTYVNNGTEITIGLFRDGNSIFSGYGILKRLDTKGANRKKCITGSYIISTYLTQTNPLWDDTDIWDDSSFWPA